MRGVGPPVFVGAGGEVTDHLLARGVEVGNRGGGGVEEVDVIDGDRVESVSADGA